MWRPASQGRVIGSILTLQRVIGNRLVHAQAVMPEKRAIKGIIFDMDGTCTEPVIDFKEMRRRAGIGKGDILGTLDSWPTEKREKGLQAIEEVEREALSQMKLMAGLNDLCKWLDQEKIPRGMITRNGQVSVDYFHKHHFKAQAFGPALCRDFRPYKPDPAGILHICEVWGISPAECMMVGDSQKDDRNRYRHTYPPDRPIERHAILQVVSGNKAGAVSVLLDITGDGLSDDLQDGQPGLVVRSMLELKTRLSTEFDLQSPT